MRIILAILVFLAYAAISPAMAAADVETRAHALGQTLRCLVCQGQSVEESNAPLARDLRRLIRADIAAGKSDDEIVTALRQVYGDAISLDPPVAPATWALWFLPPLLLAAGFVFLWRQGRKAVAS